MPEIPMLPDEQMIAIIERVRNETWALLFTQFSETGNRAEIKGNCVGWITVIYTPKGGEEGVVYSGRSTTDALLKAKEMTK